MSIITNNKNKKFNNLLELNKPSNVNEITFFSLGEKFRHA